MDSNFNKSVSDAPPPLKVPIEKKSMVPSSSSIINNPSSSTTQAAAPGPVAIKKHIIRKIIPIDPKKLQQAGLGRKIVEVLSKQKSQQANSPSNQSVGSFPTKPIDTQTATKGLSFSQSAPAASAKQSDNKEVSNKLKPPIITITGPEALTDLEKQNLATLNPLQRLAIGDRAQQKKLATKHTNEKALPKGLYAVLKEPDDDKTQIKLPTKPPKEKYHTGTLINTQTPPIKSNTTKAPQKSPQDIARKLDFQKGSHIPQNNEKEENKTKRVIPHPGDEELRGGINKDVGLIPKASIAANAVQKPSRKPRQTTKKLQQIEDKLPFINKAKSAQDFQPVYNKQQGCAKVPTPSKTQPRSQKLGLIIHDSAENTQRMDAKNTEIQTRMLNTTLPTKSPLPIQQKLDITEVSPLKVAFPTVNVPQETPLPTIDSFKKPYPLVNTNFYNLQPNICNPNDYMHTNYETSLFQQQPTTSAQVNLNRPASTTNSLVVLENKILSQDEMIDLTELRLSSKTPRFIHPHRPIPEVVIKQENPDEYQATETLLAANTVGKNNQFMQSQSGVKQPNANMPLTNKQKKIIINAQKLKLPPEQLADLARRIKQSTGPKKKTTYDIKNTQVACNTNFTQPTIPPMNYFPIQTTDIVSSAPNVRPDNIMYPMTQVYGNMYYPNQDYYMGQNYFVSRPTNIQNMHTSLIDVNMQIPSEVTTTYNYYENPEANYVMADNTLGSLAYSKSAVEIVDEPLESEDCFSAVDFIAGLGNTSNELSPEELSLNATCSLKQNYSPQKEISASPQKVTTPKIKTIVGEKLLKSTIVIESSKGQETILTNDSQDTNELEKVKEKIKIYHEMNKQKLGKSTFISKSPTKSQHFQYDANSSQVAPTNQMPSDINYTSKDTKLKDNTNVCDMDLEEISHKQQVYIPEKQESQTSRNDNVKFNNNSINQIVTMKLAASPRKQDILLKPSAKNTTTIDASSTEKSSNVIESPIKPSLVIDSTNDEKVNKKLETPKRTISNVADVLENIVTTSEPINGDNLENPPVQFIKKEVERTEMLTPKIEVSEEIKTTTKLAAENENTKNNATNANATITTKRISKFKKGKINLVPRNKPNTSDRKNEGVTTNKDAEKSIENRGNKEKECSKPDNQLSKDLKTKTTLETEQKTTDHNKELEKSREEVNIINLPTTTANREAIQNSETNKDIPIPSALIPYSDKQTYEDADKNAKFKESQMQPTVQNQEHRKPIHETASKVLGKDSCSDTIEIPKATIKTTKDTYKIRKTKTSSCTETTEIPKASIKSLASSPKKPLKDLPQAKPSQYLLEMTESLIKQRENFSSKTAEKTPHKQNVDNIMETSICLENIDLTDTSKEVSVKESQNDNNTNIVNTSNTTLSNECTQSTISKLERKPEERTQEIIGNSSDVQNIADTSEKSVQIEVITTKEDSTEKFNRHSECSKVLQDPKEIENLNKSAEISNPEGEINISLNTGRIENEQEVICLPTDPKGEVKQIQQHKKVTNEKENASATIEMSQATDTAPLNPIDIIIPQPVTQSEDDLNDVGKSKKGVAKPSKRLSRTGRLHSRKSVEQEQLPKKNENTKTEQITSGVECKDQITEKMENLNKKSQTILQNMKSARVSLIDIVKHSPESPVNKPPILPFKKSPNDTKKSEPKAFGIMTLLNRFKDQEETNEPAENLLETNKAVSETKKRETKKDLAKKDEPKISNSSLRSSTKKIEDLTTPVTRKRLSTRPLISDDDLEFLPENAEIKFNFAKTKQKDANKKPQTGTVITAPIKNRRESLYDSTHSKRTRFYSQTLETNVTITFDNLKTETKISKSAQNMEVEKSNEAITGKPTKQRKKLRKTVDDIKKSQNVVNDSDSEDDQRDTDCFLRDCEESNEFLGFEEASESNSPDTPKHIVAVIEHESKTKHGGLKNWLTTGKAISPTLDKAARGRRLRHDDVSPVASTSHSCTVLANTKQKISPRKRWDLSSNNSCEETDITDDTSPADDEEEDKIIKCGVENVINSNKKSIDNKKISLDDQSFLKPTVSLKNVVPSNECTEEKPEKTPKKALNKTKEEESKATDFVENMEQNVTRRTESNQGEFEEPSLTDKVKKIAEISVKESQNEGERLTASKIAVNNPQEENMEQHSIKTTKPYEREFEELQLPDKNKNITEKSGIERPTSSKMAANNPPKEMKEVFNDESRVTNESQNSEQCQEKHFKADETHIKCQKPQDENNSRTGSNVCQPNELEHHVHADASKCEENQKSKDGKQEKYNLLQAQETPSKSENLKTAIKRKRSTSTSSPSNKVESSFVSYKKRIIRNEDMDDHDTSQSLLEPLKVSNISPIQNLHIEDCDSGSLLTPLFPTAEVDISKPKAKPKGKVGRPRKIKTEISDTSFTQSENYEECDKKTLLSTLINNTPEIAGKNKAGRKRKSNIIPGIIVGNEEHSSNPLNTTQEGDNSICNEKPKAKRGRKPKSGIPNTLPGDNNSASTPLKKTKDADIPESDKKTTGKRGKKVDYTESNFNSRLLLIKKRDQLDTDEILTETCTGSGSIQCGLCLARVDPPQWITHLTLHYGVGWKVGEERPPIENRSFICNAIILFLKQNEGTGLSCRMCGKVFRSGLGVLYHIEQCGHKERVNCEFCQNSYAKLSLPIHLRTCRMRFEMENPKNAADDQYKKHQNTIVSNSGRFKRYSTLKAENKIKVLGKELENFTETEKPDVNPKFHIKYVQPLEMDFNSKWCNEIETLGQGSCPHEMCKFTSSDLKELNEHLKQCKRLKSGYICTFCRQAFKTEQEAIEHIQVNHQKGRRRSNDSDGDLKMDFESPTDEEPDYSDGGEEVESTDISSEEELDTDLDEQSKSKRSKYNVNSAHFYRNTLGDRKKVFDGRYSDINKEVSRKWNKFTKSNYSCEPLFNEFKPQFSILKYEDYKRYLPKQDVSMKFNFSNKIKLNETVGLPEKDIEWTELNKFEAIHKKTQSYLFLGAPIKFCSWLPLPADVNEQYLAVVYRQDMFKFIKTHQSEHHSIILLFKVTLTNKVPQLSVHYSFVVKDGPVHHLSFLPSGGYDASSNRLGLVAVATVSSCVKIYSLPTDIEVAAAAEYSEGYLNLENIRLVDIKPSFMLSFDALKQEEEDKEESVVLNTQCLQICWSEFSGHLHIFAGFSNGFLGIWNINNNPHENLNRFVINNIVNYVPINYFYLGEKNVKCIVLHYDTLGPRWLATATAVRKLILFDIRNLMNPLVQKEEVLKNILLTLDWCPIWETFIFGYDDILPNTGNGLVVNNPTNVMFQHCKIDNTFNGVTQAHYTPLLNMCVTGLNNGEIVFLDTRELHYEKSLTRKPYTRRAFYSLDVKKLNGEPLDRLPKTNKMNQQNETTDIPSDWKMYYHDYKEKFGLVFTPLLKLDDKLRKLHAKRTSPPNVIPYMRVNTLRCNLNQHGKNLVAAGYENGFLRLLYFSKDGVF